MEQADLERARQLFEDAVRRLLPGAAIDRVELLQYGDAPEIEPGELLGRIVLPLAEGADPADQSARRQALMAFNQANPGKVAELAKAFGVRKFGEGLYSNAGPEGDADRGGPAIRLTLRLGPRLSLRGLGLAGPGDRKPLTGVIAHLGPEDLETLDTLITAGVAGSRDEAVSWVIARIRERPAYELLRDRARDIEELKSQL